MKVQKTDQFKVQSGLQAGGIGETTWDVITYVPRKIWNGVTYIWGETTDSVETIWDNTTEATSDVWDLMNGRF